MISVDFLTGLLRTVAGSLLFPTVTALALLLAFAVVDTGLLLGERLRGLRVTGEEQGVEGLLALGRRRINRSDGIARLGPMLGLMGTLIPLGPGLAALASGDVATLAAQVTVAFDTTVTGLAAGVLGFVGGRLRRRWYEEAIDVLEED
jgi:hypothetical protein